MPWLFFDLIKGHLYAWRAKKEREKSERERRNRRRRPADRIKPVHEPSQSYYQGLVNQCSQCDQQYHRGFACPNGHVDIW